MNPRDPRSPAAVRHARGRAGLWRRWGGVVIGLAIGAALVVLVWHLLTDTASTKRVVADAPMLMLPPPPPPPPPPEPEKLPEPEPEKIKPVTEPEPKPVEPLEPPKDDTPPSPSKDLGDPVTMDSTGQAGNDAFGIQAGSGGGRSGTGAGGGLGSGSYDRYVASVMQQAFQRDPRTRSLVFEDIQFALWVEPDGKVNRVQLLRTSGSAEIDDAMLKMLRDIGRVPERPPVPQESYRVNVSLKGYRP